MIKKSAKPFRPVAEQWMKYPPKRTILDDINELVDWRKISALLEGTYKRDKGRPAIPPLGMFKLLLLELFYDLSDVRVVEELHDKISFQRFCEIDVIDHQVDDTSLVKFRERLREHGLIERLFNIFNKQLEDQGYIVKKGTLIDSTLVKGHHKPNATGSDGEILDPDAEWTKRGDKFHDGYKVSISVDEESEIIRQVVVTGAATHDSVLFDDLVIGDEGIVYADKGYASEQNRELLSNLGIDDGICYKARRGLPLVDWKIQHNKECSKHRCVVERKIGEAKERHKMRRFRYAGLERNKIQTYLTAIAMNMKRMVKLWRFATVPS